MREYPTFFASAGYSIKDFQNLVNSGIDLAIYQDKLPDAIKEFALSVNEQTKGVSDALKNAFGASFTTTLLNKGWFYFSKTGSFAYIRRS
jgi:hypothetical protein